MIAKPSSGFTNVTDKYMGNMTIFNGKADFGYGKEASLTELLESYYTRPKDTRYFSMVAAWKLGYEDYKDFLHHFLRDRDGFDYFGGWSFDDDDVEEKNAIYECILVYSDQIRLPVIVDPEGHKYARYVAILPKKYDAKRIASKVLRFEDIVKTYRKLGL